MQTLRDHACIVGVGETAYTRGAQKPVLRLVLEASRHAIADAGMTTHDIDGFVLPGPYLFQEQLAANLGVNDLRYSTYIQMGGASPVTALQSAAMAVAMGIATYVLVPFGGATPHRERHEPGGAQFLCSLWSPRTGAVLCLVGHASPGALWHD